MKEPQNHEPEAGYSEQRLWPIYILYSTLSLIALTVSYAWLWIVLINLVSFYGMVRLARWERTTFTYYQEWIEGDNKTQIITTRTRINQPAVKPAVSTRNAKQKRPTHTPLLAIR